MKKYIAEGLVIFASIFASFSVENIRQDSIDKEIINEAVITLGDEIESNIEYTKEHLKQVENMLYLTNELLNRYDKIKLTNLYEIHSNNPFIYNIINNGELEYIKKYNMKCRIINKVSSGSPHIVDILNTKKIALVINTGGGNTEHRLNDAIALRRATLKNKVPYCTNMSTALACIEGIKSLKTKKLEITTLQELKK